MKIYKEGSLLQFSNEDFHDGPPKNNEPLVISRILADFEARQIFVDQGSSIDIMFWTCFKKLKLSEKNLIPHQGRLIRFTSDTITSKGYVHLNLTLEGVLT